MNRKTIAAIILLITLACASCLAYPITVADARGKKTKFSEKPMRIVSITPANTEILFALGLANRVVGVTRYCNYPPEAKSKKKVGDMNVSTEAVVALKPDLVLADAVSNDSAIPTLEKLGLKVFAIAPKTMDQTARDIKTIGTITGQTKTASDIAEKMLNTIKSIRKKASARKTARRALVVVQANPLWSAGPKTFTSEMLGIVNAKNVAFDARPGFVPFSRELAVARNPEVIFVTLKSELDFFRRSAVWKKTSAVKNNRVYIVNADLLMRPGPRLSEGLKTLYKLTGF